MTEQMPVVTEERRAELIDWAEGYLYAAELYVKNHVGDKSGIAHRDLLKIALEALTGPAAGKFVLEPLERRYHHVKHGEHQHTEPKLPMVKLYTSPPVPVLRLPDEVTVNDAPGFMTSDERTCWTLGCNWYETEVKRLNGVPIAGEDNATAE